MQLERYYIASTLLCAGTLLEKLTYDSDKLFGVASARSGKSACCQDSNNRSRSQDFEC